jgi:DNA gyrase subunit A
MVITITHRGYIKRVPTKTYEKQNRGGKGKIALTTNDDDFIVDFFTASNHNTLMIVTDKGQLYWLKVYKIPEASRTAKGKAIVNLIKIENNEKIRSIIPTTDFDENKSLAFFTKKGIVKRTNLKDFSNVRNNGVKAILLDEDDELVTANITNQDTKEILIVTKFGKCVRFDIDKTREQGRNTRGSRGIKLKEADDELNIKRDEVVGATLSSNEDDEVLTISEKGIGKRTSINEYRKTARGGKGVIAMKLTSKTGNIVGVLNFDEDKDLMALTSSGKMVRVDISSIKKAGRNTSGVIVVKVGKDKVVTIAKSQKEVDTDSEEVENKD